MRRARLLLPVLLCGVGVHPVPAREGSWVPLEGDSYGVAFLNNPIPLVPLAARMESITPPRRVAFDMRQRPPICPPPWRVGWNPPRPDPAVRATVPPPGTVPPAAGWIAWGLWFALAAGLGLGIRHAWTARERVPDRPFNPRDPTLRDTPPAA